MIPSSSRELTNHVVTDVRMKAEPIMVQFLANKGKSKGNMSTCYLGLTVVQLADCTENEGGCTEAAISLLSFFEGGDVVEGGKTIDNNTVDAVLEEVDN